MLQLITDYLNNTGEFSRRIKSRHQAFWNEPNAELIRNMPMSSTDPMDAWKDKLHWQRKLSNKYNAREFALKNGCKVPDLYWKGNNIELADFRGLPEHYVIRPSIGHSSNNVFVMKKGINLFNGMEYTPETIKQHFKSAMRMTPKVDILIEEFLQTSEGNYRILDDYKFMCFNGEIASCHVINRLSPKLGYGCFYDENWNRMRPLHKAYPEKGGQIKPSCFEDMIHQVKVLSKAYEIFVRIDFYATNKGAVFGEFTPTPGMGGNFSSYGKELLIKYWDKYCKDSI